MPTPTQPRTAEAAAEPGAGHFVFPAAGKIQLVALSAFMLAAFWPILTSMCGSWFDERTYMEHGILVIPAASYMAWTKRARLAQVTRQPSRWGVALVLWGALQATLGVAAHWIWISRTAFLISLVGCLAALYGWRMIRELAYPLGTLILMVAPPTFIYERLTLDLQLLASRLGERCLELLGYSVLREGNILELVGTKLSVEEACSGIRSLLAILFTCVLYNYFFVSGTGIRTLILGLAAPIAILGNAARIIATGIASQYHRALIEGAAHETFGYISVVIAALGCLAVHGLTRYIQRAWQSRHA